MSEASVPEYAKVIEWSPDDDAFVVTIPELPECRTHGESYEGAAKNGREVIELVVVGRREDGLEIPVSLWRRRDDPIVIQSSRTLDAVRRAS